MRSEDNLALGVFAQLRKRYMADRNEQDCNLLCTAILNQIAGQGPANKESEQFLATNRRVIEEAALELHNDEVVAKAVSYFYAARTIRFSIETAQPISPQAAAVLELANRLGFYIPNTFDICGSNNAEDSILAIDKYAREFARPLVGGYL
jgi:hypothetical protein